MVGGGPGVSTAGLTSLPLSLWGHSVPPSRKTWTFNKNTRELGGGPLIFAHIKIQGLHRLLLWDAAVNRPKVFVSGGI